MKNSLLVLFLLGFIQTALIAQVPGDTIFVQAFDYDSGTRDTIVEFPDNDLTYEKIIMKYNMRCKDAQISTSTERNKGCGEWDYSCNTYIVDSTRIEKVASTHPNYIIGNVDSDVFDYTTQQTFDFYSYPVSEVQVTEVISEEEFIPLNGDDGDFSSLQTNQNSGRSLSLYTAQELSDSGLTEGSIDALKWVVVNDGGNAGFLKISIKETSETELSNQAVDLSGFTAVFNNHYQFFSGINSTVFTSPFEWDGVSNLLVEINFTNSTKDDPIALLGTTGNEVRSLYSANNYSVDLGQQGAIDISNDSLESIENEITIAFWTYGNKDILPANTTVLYGYDTNPGNRDLNIHLPWSNGSVFFDCGFSGGYDRISKMANDNDYSGKWNHWAFSKNASTGSMKIYLNGSLWTSSTGNTKAINLMNMIVGTDQNGNNNYKGRLNELSVWNSELSLQDIQLTMNTSIDSEHPAYENLVAYYPMSEGEGSEINDAKTGESGTGNNVYWSYERGDQIQRGFKETNIRPNIHFVRGEYDKTVIESTTLDSLARFPNSVNKYFVQSNEGELKHDDILLESTEYLFESLDEMIFDGITGELIGSNLVETEGSIVIEPLDFFRRFPYYNEIMSFVTPYGIGLDFGENGKSWYFDVTDFTPLLKGDKRVNMALGGQWQEEMDISFMFIVGTPPRDVIEFTQLWQGTNRSGAARINAINNDERYAPIDIAVNPNAVDFKLRSTITGHGSDGEFEQNGGTVYHYVNFDGEYEENFWSVNQECSENPVYPQGGTWVYDRQGWCPGERSKVEVLDVTEFVTPGENVEFDYGCSEPANGAGDYRYHIAHQLVSYGPANFNLDARINDVIAPSKKALYARVNPICANPIIEIQNTGSSDITSVEIQYYINEDNNIETFVWEGNLDYMESTTVQLPTGNAFYGLAADNNVFHAEIIKVNGQTDEYEFNNSYSSAFDRVKVIPDEFVIVVRTNFNSSENSYELWNDKEEVILANSLPSPNKIYRDTFDLEGCFKMKLRDNGDDGLAWWANPAQGTGYAQIRDYDGNVLHDFNADFGGGFELSFVTESFNSTKEPEWGSIIKVYPNPASELISITGVVDRDRLSIYDVAGRSYTCNTMSVSGVQQIDIAHLNSGIYFLSIQRKESVVVKRFVVK